MRQAIGCLVVVAIGAVALVALFWLAWQLIVVAAVGLAIAVAWRMFRGARS